MAPNWFVPSTTQRHQIVFPGAQEVAAEMRREQRPAAEVEEFLAEHTMEVEVRGMTAGDAAMLQELRFTEAGEGKLAFGEASLVAVELCLVSWSLADPISRDSLRRLEPLVIEAIRAVIPEGKLVVEKTEKQGANGSGPPLAAVAAPEAKDASLIE